MRTSYCLILSIAFLFVSGCGEENTDTRTKVQISGKVTLNGSDLKGGGVNLVLQPLDNSRPLTLELKDDGTFSGEAAEGENRVMVISTGAPEALELLGIPAVYETEQTPTTITIKDGQTDYPIDLKAE